MEVDTEADLSHARRATLIDGAVGRPSAPTRRAGDTSPVVGFQHCHRSTGGPGFDGPTVYRRRGPADTASKAAGWPTLGDDDTCRRIRRRNGRPEARKLFVGVGREPG